LGYHLELVGILTPRVVAVAEHRSLGLALRSYLVMEKIAEAKDLADVNYDDPSLIRCLAELIGKMHAEGFVHRDLKASNILVDSGGKPHLIDLDGLSYLGKVSAYAAVSNLKRLERGLLGKPIFNRLNWMSFLRVYSEVTGFRLMELRV
jgi:tRNA A-37 threonylcarbamoyl transferase component Bud32